MRAQPDRGPARPDPAAATRPARASPTTTTPPASGSNCPPSPSPTGRPRPPTCCVTSSACCPAPGSRCCFPRTGRPPPFCSAAWWAGAEVLLERRRDAELALVAAQHLADVEDVPEVAVLSLDAFGSARPRTCRSASPTTPPRCACTATSSGRRSPEPALDGLSVDDVLAAALDSAAAQGITGADRVLSKQTWGTTRRTDRRSAGRLRGRRVARAGRQRPTTQPGRGAWTPRRSPVSSPGSRRPRGPRRSRTCCGNRGAATPRTDTAARRSTRT